MMNKKFFAMLAFIAGILVMVSALYSLSAGVSMEGLIYLGVASAALVASYVLNKQANK
ncbi:hypothetical protein [Rhodoflexus sp.]